MIFLLINTRLENTSKGNNKDKRPRSTVFPAVLHTVNGGMEPQTSEIWYNWGNRKNLFEMGSKQEVRGLMVLHQLFLLFFYNTYASMK